MPQRLSLQPSLPLQKYNPIPPEEKRERPQAPLRMTLCAIAALMLPHQARADDPSLKPEIAELIKGAMLFDGSASKTLALTPPLDFANGITFETWILPNWTGTIAFDPCIMALRDGTKTRFSIRLTANRDAIILQSGDKAGAYKVKLDSQRISHIAVMSLAEFTEVTVNTTPSGLIDFPAPTGTADTLEVGGCTGAGPNFAGSLAEGRLWNFALGLDDIISFLPVTGNLADQDHPYQIALRAQLTDADGTPGLIARNQSLAGAAP